MSHCINRISCWAQIINGCCIVVKICRVSLHALCWLLDCNEIEICLFKKKNAEKFRLITFIVTKDEGFWTCGVAKGRKLIKKGDIQKPIPTDLIDSSVFISYERKLVWIENRTKEKPFGCLIDKCRVGNDTYHTNSLLWKNEIKPTNW